MKDGKACRDVIFSKVESTGGRFFATGRSFPHAVAIFLGTVAVIFDFFGERSLELAADVQVPGNFPFFLSGWKSRGATCDHAVDSVFEWNEYV